MVETPDPTDNFPGIVDYERPGTWPQALTVIFDDHADILEAYGREQHHINMRHAEDGLSPQNRYIDQHDHIVRRADEILSAERLLGFHCTRLVDDEIADVWANGLRLLSANFLQERISRGMSGGP